MTQVQNDITSYASFAHNISDPANADFNVLNQADILATASSVTQTFTSTSRRGRRHIAYSRRHRHYEYDAYDCHRTHSRNRTCVKPSARKKKTLLFNFSLNQSLLTVIGGVIGIIFGWSICFLLTTTSASSPRVSPTYQSYWLLAFRRQ